jgi:hypothetical protein
VFLLQIGCVPHRYGTANVPNACDADPQRQGGGLGPATFLLTNHQSQASRR